MNSSKIYTNLDELLTDIGNNYNIENYSENLRFIKRNDPLIDIFESLVNNYDANNNDYYLGEYRYINNFPFKQERKHYCILNVVGGGYYSNWYYYRSESDKHAIIRSTMVNNEQRYTCIKVANSYEQVFN